MIFNLICEQVCKVNQEKHTYIFASLSKFYRTAPGIIMQSFKLIGQFKHTQINNKSYPLPTDIRPTIRFLKCSVNPLKRLVTLSNISLLIRHFQLTKSCERTGFQAFDCICLDLFDAKNNLYMYFLSLTTQ